MHAQQSILTRKPIVALAALSVALLGNLSALAQTESPVQAKAKSTGLDIVSKVMIGGSDAESAVFQKEVLPNMIQLLSQSLGEKEAVNDAAFALDPSKLTLKTESDVRVYFIGEGAAYQNSLGFNTEGGGVKSGDPLLIFPNASSAFSALSFSASTTASSSKKDDDDEKDDDKDSKLRTKDTPLVPGDFVDLGSFTGGTQLDFFLIANGYNGGNNVYSTDQSINPDGINHVVSFAYAMPDSPYLIIGFEDLYGGGDQDFNDLLFAIDIGAANVAALTATPEPATFLTLGAFLSVGLGLKRRQDRARAVPATVQCVQA